MGVPFVRNLPSIIKLWRLSLEKELHPPPEFSNE